MKNNNSDDFLAHLHQRSEGQPLYHVWYYSSPHILGRLSCEFEDEYEAIIKAKKDDGTFYISIVGVILECNLLAAFSGKSLILSHGESGNIINKDNQIVSTESLLTKLRGIEKRLNDLIEYTGKWTHTGI